jgi:hypothetical protein
MEIVVIIVPLVLASIGYLIQQYVIIVSKDRDEKEKKYLHLLEYISSFDASLKGCKQNQANKTHFLKNFRKCSLYATDEVIKAGNKFCKSIHKDSKDNNEERNTNASYFMLCMRRDILGRRKTKLTSKDLPIFRLL